MASTGVHSNGFSLVRKVFEMTRESLDTYYDELGTTLGEALLAPTRIYVKALKSIKDAGVTNSCMQPYYRRRLLRECSTYAERRNNMQLLTKDSYPVLPIFDLLAKKGRYRRENDV